MNAKIKEAQAIKVEKECADKMFEEIWNETNKVLEAKLK